MKFSLKRITALLGTIALGFGSLTMVSGSAQAAPYSGAFITLVSPVLDATNTSEAAKNQQMADGWVSNGWFGSGLKYQRTFAPVGSTLTFVYNVKDANGNPLAGQTVTLRVNKQYSESQAAIRIDGQMAKPGTSTADGLRVSRVTDSFGNVSFTMQNLDAEGTAEQKPAAWTDAPIIAEDGLDDIHVQVLPQIVGEKEDHSVITEVHFYNNPTPEVQPITAPTIRLATPQLSDTNSIRRSDLETLFSVDNSWYPAGINVRQAYLPTGSAHILTYRVTDDNGQPLRNTEVKLHVNKARSGSNAKVTDGTTPTDPTKNNSPDNGDLDQAVWTGTTDAFGTVVFNYRNTDTVGGPTPATKTTPVPTTGRVFSQLWPEVTAGADIADMTEFHFFGTWKAPVRSVAATISGTAKVGKILTARNGTWTGTAPIAYTYKWYRCTLIGKAVAVTAPTSANKCTVIAGATKSTYKLVAADKGKYVRVLVTAKNPVGTAYSLSKTTVTKIG
ncbi:MAG: Stenotrophomonas phage [Actinomycetota bacterium]